MDYIDKLKDAIRHLHGCEADYVETVPVKEVFQGQTVWDGKVEVFTVDHPQTSRAYAWSYRTDTGGERFLAVLELPPVDSAENAVRAAILSDAKS